MSYKIQADLGGQTGYGPVDCEHEDGAFHAGWEPQAMALMLSMGVTGAWNVDMVRSVLESLPDYSKLSYYEKWIKGLEKLLIDCGLVGSDEIAAAHMLRPPLPVTHVLQAADVPDVLAAGASTLRPAVNPARFAIGDRVRMRAALVEHHTRLPAYARGKIGRIERVHGAHVFPDAHAQGLGENPQWLYTVVFRGSELWGGEGSPGLSVSIDAWESYMERLT